MMYKLSLILLIVSLLMGLSVEDEALNIPIKKAPYKVLIVESKNNSEVVCAGAILSEHWVITTATCSIKHRAQPNTLMVRSGSGTYNVNGGLHYVKQIIIHPDFDEQDTPHLTGQGDIALLRLLYCFHLSMTVAPIPLPPHVTPAGTTAHLISWPKVGGKWSASLKALMVITANWVECYEMLSHLAGIILGETTLCTSSVVNFQAEEGDPLVVSGTLTGLYKNQITNTRTLQKALPQFHVDISSFVTWIEENIAVL